MPDTSLPSPPLTEPIEKKDPSYKAQMFSWSTAGFSENILANGLQTLVTPIYNVGMNLDPKWVGWGLAIPRFWKAIIGPLLGNLSDNARTPWGRRRPFVFAGTILCAIFFAAIWMPPSFLTGKDLTLHLPQLPAWLGGFGGLTQVPYLFIFFLILSFFFYLGFVIYSVGAGGMAFELATDYNERTRIVAWKNFFGCAAGFLLPWVWKISQHPWITGLVPKGVNAEVIGMRHIAIVLGVVILVNCLIQAFVCRERGDSQIQPKFSMWKAIWETLHSRPFLILAGMVAILLVGLFIVSTVGMYIGLYYVCQGDKQLSATLTGWSGNLYGLGGMVFTPLAPFLSKRIGKKGALLISMLAVMIGALASWYTNTPKYPYLSLAGPLIQVPGMTCIWILVSSMMMDVCDLDELKSGLRREGTFGSVFGLVFEIGIAITFVLAGYLPGYLGYVVGPTQTPQALFNMRVAFALVPAAFLVIVIYLAWIFPVTEKSAREVRAILDARKAAKMAEFNTL